MQPRRIAIVGAGISGLTAAHLLREHHDVTVFEANAYAGGHTNTIRVDTPDATHHVDTGFIVLNDRNYPTFRRLLGRLGVETQPSNMSMSVTSEVDDFEYSSVSLSGLFAQRSNAVSPGFLRMLRDVRRFQRESRELLAPDGDARISLGEYLDRNGYSQTFIDRMLVPQASAVWSADPRQMWEFPARFLVQFFANHGMLGLRDRPRWDVVQGGSARYVEQLVAPLSGRVHLNAPIAVIDRVDGGVDVTPAGSEAIRFDEVIVAAHSDQALRMLNGSATDAERRVLSAIPYQANEAVLHTDASLLPRRRRAWASWNYHHLATPPARTTVTYHMNRLQSLDADREFCVTLNHTAAIDPSTIIGTYGYHHPVFTPDGIAAQTEHAAISGRDRIHFAGAYWANGFHEDGVVSGARVAAHFGATL